MRASAPRRNLFNSVSNVTGFGEDQMSKHILKRFTVFSSATVRGTIKKCESLGVLQN